MNSDRPMRVSGGVCAMRGNGELPEPPITCPCCGTQVVGLTRHAQGAAWTPAQDAFIQRAVQHGASTTLVAYVLGTEQRTVAGRINNLRSRKS